MFLVSLNVFGSIGYDCFYFLVIGFLKQILGNHNTELSVVLLKEKLFFCFCFFNLKCVRKILKRLHLVYLWFREEIWYLILGYILA